MKPDDCVPADVGVGVGVRVGVDVGVGVGVGVRVGVGVGVIEGVGVGSVSKLAVIVPGPLIMAVVAFDDEAAIAIPLGALHEEKW